MINSWYPSHAVYVQGLLEAKYQEQKIEYEPKLPKAHTPAVEKKSDRKHRIVDEVDFFPDAAQGSSENKLTVYISGRYKLTTSEASNCLTWWKDHCHEFPVLLMLARDYLASCATSASVERCFSAAADICGRKRGSLAARTIERCVSSHQWLLQGISPDGSFSVAQDIVAKATTEKEKNESKLVALKVAS
ncbi:hypothetical protein MJO28_000373 [Puccinia striiformis f. sp. tritici]|uniref:Uncharacterized protein n=1 Tax=Puccinia striiformis f. sp. tritici TaxID=168172 RepID=A0ACC0EX28_9BASI|nr:hypothetical protein MJO28_000373 [Puccinia striiformis f. sp. tritici]